MTIDDVRRALGRPLRGWQRKRGWPAVSQGRYRKDVESPACKQAGVLVLLYPLNGQLCFPLTKRPESVEYHKGQISLPAARAKTASRCARRRFARRKKKLAWPRRV